jgi:hypothetical protein
VLAYGLRVGTHEEDPRSLTARWRQWRRYRRFLAVLVADAHKHGYVISPGSLEVMKAEARAAARAARGER